LEQTGGKTSLVARLLVHLFDLELSDLIEEGEEEDHSEPQLPPSTSKQQSRETKIQPRKDDPKRKNILLATAKLFKKAPPRKVEPEKTIHSSEEDHEDLEEWEKIKKPKTKHVLANSNPKVEPVSGMNKAVAKSKQAPVLHAFQP